MTKEEFKSIEKICKDGWECLAETGDIQKPEDFNVYICKCPACELAFIADIKTSLPDVHSMCVACPVTTWRRSARLGKETPTCSTSGAFIKWNCSRHMTNRKYWARIISNMRWSWIPEYEMVRLEEIGNAIRKYL